MLMILYLDLLMSFCASNVLRLTGINSAWEWWGDLNFFLVKLKKGIKELSSHNPTIQKSSSRDLASKIQRHIHCLWVHLSNLRKKEVWKGRWEKYWCMIGCLFYLTTSMLDIILSVRISTSCPKFSHLNVVKQIFKYLKGTIGLGFW